MIYKNNPTCDIYKECSKSSWKIHVKKKLYMNFKILLHHINFSFCFSRNFLKYPHMIVTL